TKEFISKQWNNEVVEYFLDLIDKRILQIKSNPNIAPLIPNTQFRKLLIHKSVSLFYINTGKLTKVLLLWDNRQNPIDLTNKLTVANIT
ncbi:type II toxin-antitoxin system RelE/ParE family toxin, partial [Fulvivirga aurantia]|uniref:type II toxin-antitoxin system RelE/ParE family toxin n=1 Tax=Fulvivirga aurantia TaxID=2529383 RepID=UPI001CA3CD7C